MQSDPLVVGVTSDFAQPFAYEEIPVPLAYFSAVDQAQVSVPSARAFSSPAGSAWRIQGCLNAVLPSQSFRMLHHESQQFVTHVLCIAFRVEGYEEASLGE